ncbi:palmitoyltransferase ZDHHC18-A [Myxocyprinus asiaticus]|uniref:palmitoyltransferase ZDHHC18-A n=1 Tax=Myxocyprinus asiaticus TaxID=70543 RepID=UPI002223A0DB|nr:palmitoyltransferase ZDHHC18-A [Myxocyprinus asiaticus]
MSNSYINLDIWTVVRFASFTRLLSLLLQALLNAVIPDHVADAFSPPRAEIPLLLDPTVKVLFGGLSHWDAEHFLFIAERGYVYEHNFAFFPLFPFILRLVADTLLWPLFGFLTLHGRLVFAVAIGNSALFVLSAMALYKLSHLVLQDRKLALVTALMYCLTPANIFMVAGYSETLFAALTFAGLWQLEKGFTLGACLLMTFATSARANGLVNAGFLLYLKLQQGFAYAWALSNGAAGGGRFHHYAWALIRFLLTGAVYAALVALPFCLFQFYGFQTFCHPNVTQDQIHPVLLNLAQNKGYRVPDMSSPTPSWCQWRIPLLYSYIQDFYWDVGFLRYFQLKQIPNFILALPVAALGFIASYTYILKNPVFCMYLGLGDHRRTDKDRKTHGFYNPRVFVYIVHNFVLLLFGIFCMHVQVLTRFLASSSPLLYWISSHLLFQYEPLLRDEKPFTHDQRQQKDDHLKPVLRCFAGMHINNPIIYLLMHWQICSFYTHCILGYFILYWFLGLALHCNFLPWT